jgi:putative FmdB family regulatory protein
MPTYLYKCETCNKEFEYEHSINEKLEECPKSICSQQNLPPQKVKRLIASGTNFMLMGGGWAKDNYK